MNGSRQTASANKVSLLSSALTENKRFTADTDIQFERNTCYRNVGTTLKFAIFIHWPEGLHSLLERGESISKFKTLVGKFPMLFRMFELSGCLCYLLIYECILGKPVCCFIPSCTLSLRQAQQLGDCFDLHVL